MSGARPFIAHIDDVAEVEGAYPAPFDGEKLSLYRDLGRATGSVRVGYAFERVLPGRRTSFTHAHSHEEEFVFVIAGRCHVRLVEAGVAEEIPLRAGHAVTFPAGTGIAHCFVNRGVSECALLVVGERRPEEDLVDYPDDPEYDAHHAKTRSERHWFR